MKITEAHKLSVKCTVTNNLKLPLPEVTIISCKGGGRDKKCSQIPPRTLKSAYCATNNKNG